MKNRGQMSCPKCEATMNHHADKLDLTTGTAEGSAGDLGLGAVLQEVYGCPRCGNIELRRAT